MKVVMATKNILKSIFDPLARKAKPPFGPFLLILIS